MHLLVYLHLFLSHAIALIYLHLQHMHTFDTPEKGTNPSFSSYGLNCRVDYAHLPFVAASLGEEKLKVAFQ